MEVLSFFRSIHTIPSAALEGLNQSLQPSSFSKGEYITQPGQVQRYLYFIRKGVQVSYFETDKKQHVVAFCYPPGACAIPDSFLSQSPSKYYLQCVTESEFESISYEALQRLFDKWPPLERLFRKMTEQILVGVINRHLELQTLTIEERFRTFAQRSPHILQLVPHRLIASYLNIDPTNFSKLYNSIKI